MKVLITGASGQLGHDIARFFSGTEIEYLGVSSRDLDITDRDAVRNLTEAYHPDAVLHCAAYTKVDRAEDEPELCIRVNADGTRNIAEACRELGSKLLYVSTDYVFRGNGDKPWETDDEPGPLNVYGKSKLAGEVAVRDLLERYFIVRTSWVIGEQGNNFVMTMLRLAEDHRELRVVGDQIGSPTFTADLAPLLCEIIRTENFGTYHATNEGFCSWADLAEKIFFLAGKNVAVNRVSTEDYAAKALRPKNSRLSKASLDEGGFVRLPAWDTSLERFLKEDRLS